MTHRWLCARFPVSTKFIFKVSHCYSWSQHTHLIMKVVPANTFPGDSPIREIVLIWESGKSDLTQLLYIVKVQGDEVKWTWRGVSQKIHKSCCCPFTRRSFHCVNQQLQCTLVSQRPISTPKSNSQLSPSIPQCLLSNQHRLTLPHSTTNLPGRLHIQQRHLYLIRYL